MRIRFIATCVLLAASLIACSTNRQLAGSQSSKIENVHFDQDDDIVTVHYDLISDSESARFNIQLLLEFEENQFIELNSNSVQGDVGSDIRPGTEKKITWAVLEDYPNGLESNQIQFAINAWQPASNNRSWIYKATGALVVGAGISAAILLSNNGGGGENSPLPAPPSRPGS